jgi:hypothetical protein
MTEKKHILRIICLFSLLLIVACVSQPEIRVEVLPRYDALFNNEKGWTGADGVYSLALADNLILWLFGDTWVGEIRDGRHVNATIINNSIAIQREILPPGATVSFYSGRTPDDTPQAFILPADGNGWFWIYHGALAPDGLYLFLLQIERTDAPLSFGFKVIGTWLGHIANFRDPPARWRITQHKIPWANFSAAGENFFGSWVLKKDGFFFIYGIDEEVVNGVHQKFMILARTPETELAHFNQWRFYAQGKWTADFTRAEHLCSNMANEYSVSYLTALGKYAAIYTENGISKNIVARFAPNPWGPWSKPAILYQCPEVNRNETIFCYAAKGHPDISIKPDELIVSYVANSTDFEKMAKDASLYRPRFLRLWFTKHSQNKPLK